ncbi:twitch domain-containing radical SAM protein [bacterium]|nr:twitch domain-containing radical SAM protein [bacterium]
MYFDDTPENFCIFPWIGISNDPDGSVKPCCIYQDHIKDELGNKLYVQKTTVKDIIASDYMQNLRQAFRENKKPSACEICWQDEKNGYTSKRLNMQKRGFFLHFDEKENLLPDWRKEPEYPMDYQMIFNNSCNLKCRSCYASHSTQWRKENTKFDGDPGYDMPYKQSGEVDGKLWESRYEWYPHLYNIDIIGGEPMYIKQWHTFFEELISLGYSKNITVTMSTNCTLLIPDLLNRLAENFKTVSIGLSVDGTEEILEYLRHPADWKTVYSNLLFYNNFALNKNVFIQITCTLGWLNAINIIELYNIYKKECTNFTGIWFNIIHNPEFMSLSEAPEELKKYISEQWKNHDWQENAEEILAIEKFMFSKVTSDEEFKTSCEKFKIIDARRNENLYDVIPREYENFLKEFINE